MKTLAVTGILRSHWSPLGILLMLSLGGAASGQTFSAYGTATIDGVITPGEWTDAAHFEFVANTPFGGTTPATLYVMNDDANLYLAVRFTRSVLDAGNSLSFEFDSNCSATHDVGDDAIVLTSSGNVIDDVVKESNGATYGQYDLNFGGTNDGVSSFWHDGTFVTCECARSLNSGDANDFAVGAGQSLGFILDLRMIDAAGQWPDAYGDTRLPAFGYMEILISERPLLEVGIDIKPDSPTNPIDLSSSGVVPVAIMTDDAFDATTLDPLSVRFGPGRASEKHGKAHLEDVNGDGRLDMVLHFSTREAAFSVSDVSAVLTGRTYDGDEIEASDAVTIVGRP